ncbi:ABC transporter permease [Labrys monachus]|uniref:Ribose/xylose/arabinose/galactoside ABC-type transport system permease subunit n=1 Tax=Labrys monachus TaxID=217067 RepID=A0ABU0FIJ5_9HYPH|nr:ABC transporter permease [Labrys monachus]MDQ0394434.1 ribose/xylose/arabinose/galactoside ABC-type transport system permease subunit [Labrys monachus]
MSVDGQQNAAALSRDRRARLDLLTSGNVIRLAILVLLVAVFAVITRGATIGLENLSNVLIQSSIRGIAACGQAMVVLTAGLDLSVSGVMAAALMTGGSLITMNPQYSLFGTPISPVLGIAAMIAVGVAFGTASGTLVARLRLPALIVTLGAWQIGNGLAYQVTGSGFVDKLPASIAFIGQGSLLHVPNPVILFFIVVALSHFLLHRTAFGAEIYAVGGNARTAFISGVRVVRVRIAVFAAAGFFYAIGAVISMSRYMSATLAQSTGLELSTIAAVAIGGVSLSGGKGSILGVFLGVLIIGVIDNGLSVTGVGPAYQAILKGAIIIVAVMSDGLLRR